MSLVELAGRVRRREVAARELVALALERIEALDGSLGAVVALRAEEALQEASRLDDDLSRGAAAGALAGVPFLVKDIEDLAGLPTTHGSLLFRDAPPAAVDGLVPGRLRAAGAIPVGKSNTPEFAVEGFTANLVFGTTRNPWDPRCSPGGSSGGSGAAIAAGMVPLATATDGGGSIRIPASLCGLAGIKPTNGVVGRSPIPSWIDLSTDGPLAATVGDLRLLLGIEAGPAPGDPSALPAWRLGPGGRPGRVLAAPRFTDWGPLPRAVEDAFGSALEALESVTGASVDRVDPAGLFRSGNPDEDWFVLTGPEHVAQLGRAVIEAELGRMHPATRAFFEGALAVDPDAYLAARRRRFAYVGELDELLGTDGVIVTPTLASEGWLAEGPPFDGDGTGPPPDVYNTAVQNITGHPAVSVPAGRLANGLPFGLQLTGPRFRDDLVLDLAEAWERARPWPATAPGYPAFEV